MSLMVSISGIRGIVGTSLTPDVIVKYVSAYAEYCRHGSVVIGRDGRITGKSIGHIVSSTLLQMGCDVIALGICPTPTVALAVEQKKAAGGISITASHNPMEWNGLKFFAPTGIFLDTEENQSFWALAEKPSRSYAGWQHQGHHRSEETFLDEHIRNVLSLSYINLEPIRNRKFKVVVDCVNASGSVIVPRLLRTLGCDVIEMNCDLSGIFAHTPEPIPENLGELAARVKSEKAEIGFAVDPDADRLVIIDEKGEPIGEEYSLAFAVEFVLSKESQSCEIKPPRTEKPKVAVNLSTTRAIDDIVAKHGAQLFRTAVGEINVAKKMKEIGAVIGGEGNGGIILPASHIGRDALVGIVLTLQYLAEQGGTVSELKQSLPQYSITKGKVQLGSVDSDSVLKTLQDRHAGLGRVNTLDGLKIDFADSWVHLRKSNTEPIIRIIAEAPTKHEADALVRTFTSEITNT